jgi:RNA polymerase sigma-70 factor (ECF subfamily)
VNAAAAATDQRSSDWSLIERVVARDETALAALYDRYSGLLCGILNRILRDAQAAEEILQDVFFQVWRNAAQFDPARGSIAGWLVVAARNRAISRLRRRNPGETEELVENTVVLPTNIESEAAQKEMMGKVRSALSDLSQDQQQCVELAYFEGLTHSEIAARTGDPLGTVKTRLRSAVDALRKKLPAPAEQRVRADDSARQNQ